MYKSREYKPRSDPDYRPNTRKLYEDHHGIKLPKTLAVHHILPPRLGGSHDISNLVALTRDEHIAAHLKLYEEHGDVRDLCASYMLRGLSHEARKVAAAAGGRAGHVAMKARGQKNGFQLQPKKRMIEIAKAAGAIGGRVQRDLKLGIHGLSPEDALEVCRLGGLASCAVNGWRDSAVQAENGKRGGVKNAGYKWYHDGTTEFKYTAAQQAVEPFDAFIERTGMTPGLVMPRYLRNKTPEKFHAQS